MKNLRQRRIGYRIKDIQSKMWELRKRYLDCDVKVNALKHQS